MRHHHRASFAITWVTLAACLPAVTAAPAGSGPTDRLRLANEYGVTLSLMGRAAEAESVFVAALALSPRDPAVLNNLGNLSLLRGETDLALAFYERAAAADSTDGGIRLNRGTAYHLAGDDPAMLAEYGRGVRLAGGRESAEELMGLGSGPKRTETTKAAGPAAVSSEEILAQLARALSQVPGDSPADSTQTPTDAGQSRSKAPVEGGKPTGSAWRTAGPRAADRSDLARVLYWKR